MKLCSYVVKHDYGFAPNPFWNICTLATCTPNHMGIKLKKGDWLLGHSTADEGHGVIYAMRVSEVLDLNDYYRDPRYAQKKASGRTWQKRCGDNIYYLDESEEWVQALAYFHGSQELIDKDLRYHKVYISDHFFYFGENAPPVPDRFHPLIQRRWGVSCHKASLEPLVQEFIDWIEENYEQGKLGDPRDREIDECAMTERICVPSPVC